MASYNSHPGGPISALFVGTSQRILLWRGGRNLPALLLFLVSCFCFSIHFLYSTSFLYIQRQQCFRLRIRRWKVKVSTRPHPRSFHRRSKETRNTYLIYIYTASWHFYGQSRDCSAMVLATLSLLAHTVFVFGS